MRFDARGFRDWPNKSITLLGMSGVGKTHLANLLRQHHWFHYAGDYRIGTRYLDEPILDNIKQKAMQIPFLRDLLRSDSIYIGNNITVDNLHPVSTFLGMIGNPELGGLSHEEFVERQRLYKEAEIKAMKDVPKFIRKAREIYGYDHFVNDAGGSLCELDDPEVLKLLAESSLILYIRATDTDVRHLLKRAEESPKPLLYREDFLEEHLKTYQAENNLPYAALIDPPEFARWVFPQLFRSRVPRYEAIATKHGYTITSDELAKVQSEADFLSLVESAVERG